MEGSFNIRPMNVDDLKLAISWANKESWNLSEQDAEPFLSLDPEGFFIGSLDGESVAAISAAKYSNYAHIGFYLVKEELRNKGYGKKIFEHGFNYAKDTDSVGLDAVEAQKPNYEKWGFRTHDHVFRMTKKAEGTLSTNLVELRQVPIEEICEYDTPVFGEDRKVLLSKLIEQKRCYGLGKIKDNKLVGYGIMRECMRGLKIGPFLADDKETAEEILEGLQSFVMGKEVIIDIFESNKDAKEIVERQKWSPVNKYFRMYLNGVPKTDVKKVYSSIIEVG